MVNPNHAEISPSNTLPAFTGSALPPDIALTPSVPTSSAFSTPLLNVSKACSRVTPLTVSVTPPITSLNLSTNPGANSVAPSTASVTSSMAALALLPSYFTLNGSTTNLLPAFIPTPNPNLPAFKPALAAPFVTDFAAL